MDPTECERVLCVDDDANLLEGLSRLLSLHYEISTAQGGREGLELMREQGPFAVVISDMRMPEMDGATFLARVKESSPDTVRILLTGQADLPSAIDAINKGQIFRFLTKPCGADALTSSIDAALEQRRLVVAERVLLEQTLAGSIKTLVDVLALVNPAAFGRAMRIKKYVCYMFEQIDARDRWALEVAALLSQVPCVTLRPETVERYCSGAALSPKEQALIDKLPEVAEQLFKSIPRLDPVLAMLAGLRAGSPGAPPLGSLALRIALDYDTLLAKGCTSEAAVQKLRRSGAHPATLLEAFARGEAGARENAAVRQIGLRELKAGMVLVQDVWTRDGILVIPAGNEVSAAMLQRLTNFAAGAGLKEPFTVGVPRNQEARA